MSPYILRLLTRARFTAIITGRTGGKHRRLIIRSPSWRELLRHHWN